jgi:hypothetical protein
MNARSLGKKRLSELLDPIMNPKRYELTEVEIDLS